VDFNVGKKDRLENKFSGKKKKGAIVLEPLDPICEVTTSDGQVYLLRATVKGSLLEVNDGLISNPNLLKQKSETDGYLAIIQPKLSEREEETVKHLLTLEQYHKIRHH